MITNFPHTNPPASIYFKNIARLAQTALLFLLAQSAQAENYTWNTTSTGQQWSSASYWSPTVATGGPGAGDTAYFIGNTSGANYTINYNTGVSGTLGALYMINTTATATKSTTLNLYKSLTLTGGGALYSSVSGGYMNLNFAAANVTFTIGDGSAPSTFTFGDDSSATSSSQQILLNSGNNNLSGCSIVIATSSTFNWINGVASSAPSIQVPIAVNSGATLNFQTDATSCKYVIGNLTVNSGGNVTNTGSHSGSEQLNLQGSTYIINGQMSGFTAGNAASGGSVVLGAPVSSGGSVTQTVSFGTGSNAIDLGIRVAAASATSTVILSSGATGSVNYSAVGENIIDSFNFYGGSAIKGSAQVLKLGSNLAYGGSASNAALYYGGVSGMDSVTDVIDLNGYTFDSNQAYAPSWSTTGVLSTSLISIINSAGSASPGTFVATYYNLGNTTKGGANTAVGSNVILQATNANATNDLSNTLGTGAIDSTSIFYYSGSGTSALKSNRAVGGIEVGTGSSDSVLELSSSITAQGVVTINSGATLNLTDPAGTSLGTAGTYDLTAAGLSGSGTITNNAAGATAVSLILNSTTANTFSGVISDYGTSAPLSLTLSSGTQILGGANTYHGTTRIDGGNLIVNGSIASSSMATINAGAILSGSGRVGAVTVNAGGTLKGTLVAGAISGSGLVAPGDSPGILTAESVTGATGLSFAFELTQTGAPVYSSETTSGNDLLHLTGATPFVGSLDASNTISVYLGGDAIGSAFQGGFFTDNLSAELLKNAVKNATFVYYVLDTDGDTTGDISYNGGYYTTLSSSLSVAVSAVSVTGADFSTGTVGGSELEFTVVPEPGAWAMLVSGIGTLVWFNRMRRFGTFHHC